MKVCPTCRRTYEDDGLNFCLEDGSVLTLSAADSAAPTIAMSSPRPTAAHPASGIQTSRDAQQQQSDSRVVAAKRKSSRAWVWVLGIVGILVLVCGGGAAGVFFYVASVANSNSGNRTIANTNNSRSNTTNRPSPSPSTTEFANVQAVDLTAWVKEPTIWVETEREGDEFLMTSKQAGYYYVLVAKDEIDTGGGATRVTVRNVTDGDVDLGYGLIFHSSTTPLELDYAFLIDSKRKRYKVVRHEDEEETVVKGWTNSSLIEGGTAENLLEARDKTDKIELYINGQLATTIANKNGPKSGVPGLYAGYGAKIGFKKLEVAK